MHQLEPEPHVVEDLEFKEVVSVTRASGGVANNIIPGRFELNVNYRFAPDRTLEEAIHTLRELCSDADLFEITDSAPAAYPEVSHPLFQELATASGGVVASKQGWTDVAQLAQRGIPAVNLGPGETALAHKPGESVRLDDLVWAYEALVSGSKGVLWWCRCGRVGWSRCGCRWGCVGVSRGFWFCRCGGVCIGVRG